MEQDSMVTIDCVIPIRYHRTIMGRQGVKVQEVKSRFDVEIKFPGEKEIHDYNQRAEDSSSFTFLFTSYKVRKPNPWDIIKITGQPGNCEKAKQAIIYSLSTSFKMEIPEDYRPSILWSQAINDLSDQYSVYIERSYIEEEDDDDKILYITGSKEAIDSVKVALESLMARVEVFLDRRVYSRLIGTRGSRILEVKSKYHVEIKFPDISDPDSNLVVIFGKESDCEEAKNHLLNLEDKYMEHVTASPYSNNRKESNHFFHNPKTEGPSSAEVKGGPWKQTVPDTTSTEDFPCLGASGGSQTPSMPWGPRR